MTIVRDSVSILVCVTAFYMHNMAPLRQLVGAATPQRVRENSMIAG